MAKPWYNGPWPKIRLAVLSRDGYDCQIRSPVCTRHASEADHIIRPADGGPWWTMTNLRAACPPCNRGRYHRERQPSRVW